MQPLPPVTDQLLDEATLKRIVGRPDPLILEVGCNDGHDTKMFLELFPKGRVHAFEPDPRPRARFERSVRNSRAKVWDVAIGASDGEAEFHMSSGDQVPPGAAPMPKGMQWDFSGSLRAPTKHRGIFPWVKFEQTMKVRTMRLDTFAAQQKLRRVDFLWIDAQGCEGDVIAGAPETLKMTRWLFMECVADALYEGQLDARQLLAMLPDFEVVARYPDDMLLRHRTLR